MGIELIVSNKEDGWLVELEDYLSNKLDVKYVGSIEKTLRLTKYIESDDVFFSVLHAVEEGEPDVLCAAVAASIADIISVDVFRGSIILYRIMNSEQHFMKFCEVLMSNNIALDKKSILKVIDDIQADQDISFFEKAEKIKRIIT